MKDKELYTIKFYFIGGSVQDVTIAGDEKVCKRMLKLFKRRQVIEHGILNELTCIDTKLVSVMKIE
jgi:hypothetical protein